MWDKLAAALIKALAENPELLETIIKAIIALIDQEDELKLEEARQRTTVRKQANRNTFIGALEEQAQWVP